MSYEQKAEDYHNNKVYDIEEHGIKTVERGNINNTNDYIIEYDGSMFYLSINSEDFDQDSNINVLRHLVKTLKYYEVFRKVDKWLNHKKESKR